MADLSGFELGAIKRGIDTLQSQVAEGNNRVASLQSEVNSLQKKLEEMSRQFVQMAADQQRSAALQRAISELVRVRQEINRHFKDYETVRATMVGVLQATDLALVKRTTISRVSEELMLATPSYWLAPCLVAVAAWIDNDRALAERAIAEAMRRDEEKTALTMALICRRNGRTDTCFEWLAIYFSKQDAKSFTLESFSYVDAYVNGVFGVDRRHLCDGFVKKWITEVREEDDSFEERQKDVWRSYCCQYVNDMSSRYPVLRNHSPEFSSINGFIGRITSLEFLTEKFRGIRDVQIDQQELKDTIDSELIHLVEEIDPSESSLRREEEYLTLVKETRGDEDKAQQMLSRREEARQSRKMDLVDQMAGVLMIEDGESISPSKRRTALSFLGDYVNEGVHKYLTEKRDNFPDAVNVKIGRWSGKLGAEADLDTAKKSFSRHIDDEMEHERQKMASTKPKAKLVGSVILFVLAGICLALGLVAGIPAVIAGAILAVIAIGLLVSRSGDLKELDINLENLKRSMEQERKSGLETLDEAGSEWAEIQNMVNKFDEEGYAGVL